MQYSKQGIALTESFEGLRTTAYQDQVGVWTIGYGHTKGVHPGMTCTEEQANQWLQEDACDCENDVNSHVKVALNQNEFDALVDFCINLGGTSLNTSTLLKLVNASDKTDAAKEFEKWDHAGGKVVAGLLRRRQAEENLFKHQDS